MKTLIQFTIAVSCIFLIATGTSSAQDITNADGSPFETAYCNIDSNYEIVGIPAGGTFTGCGVTKKSGKWYFNPVVADAGKNVYPYQCKINYTDPGNNVISKLVTIHAPLRFLIIADTVSCGYLELHGGTTIAGAVKFRWTPQTGLITPDSMFTYGFINSTTTFTLTANDLNSGCVDSTKRTVRYQPKLIDLNLKLVPDKYLINQGDSVILSTSADYSYNIIKWSLYGGSYSSNKKLRVVLHKTTTISVQAKDTLGCIDTASVQIAAFPTSVNTLGQSENISIYPNPVKDVINIDAAITVDATITTIDGRIVLKQRNAKQVNIAHLAAGTYIIQVMDKQGNVLRREQVVKVAQ